MRIITSAAIAAGFVSLAACHPSTGAQVQQTYDNAADRLDNSAANAAAEGNTAKEAVLENQADTLRDHGKELKDSLKHAKSGDIVTSNSN